MRLLSRCHLTSPGEAAGHSANYLPRHAGQFCACMALALGAKLLCCLLFVVDSVVGVLSSRVLLVSLQLNPGCYSCNKSTEQTSTFGSSLPPICVALPYNVAAGWSLVSHGCQNEGMNVVVTGHMTG